MNENQLTVGFDDEKLSIEQIITALNGAGYAVPEYAQVD